MTRCMGMGRSSAGTSETKGGIMIANRLGNACREWRGERGNGEPRSRALIPVASSSPVQLDLWPNRPTGRLPVEFARRVRISWCWMFWIWCFGVDI